MKNVFLALALFVASVLVFTGVAWIVQGADFFLYSYFAPRYEATRREVFEQSKAYNQGVVQELQNMQFEWEKADPAHRDALASIILHRAADYDEARLPQDLREFLRGLRRRR